MLNLSDLSSMPVIAETYDVNIDTKQRVLDDELGRRIADEDELAMEIFVYRWGNYIDGRVSMSVSDVNLRDEIYSDVMSAVWKSAPRWRQECPFAIFLFGVIRYEIFHKWGNARRKNQRFLKMKDRFSLETETDRFTSHTEPEAVKSVLDAEIGQKMLEALEVMTENHVKAFKMRHYEEKSPGDIAEILGVTHRKARRLVTEARGRIREVLTPPSAEVY